MELVLTKNITFLTEKNWEMKPEFQISEFLIDSMSILIKGEIVYDKGVEIINDNS